MTHLPLTLGEYTTASDPVTITRIGKHGKWAFDVDGAKLTQNGSANVRGRIGR